MKKIVLASENKAKILAVKEVFFKIYPNFQIDTIEVDSGVSNTPSNDDEGIQGCLNRISIAKEKIKGRDVYIGLEGIISRNKFGIFICGWAVIDMPHDKRISYGSSAKVRLPDYIGDKITNFGELSSLVKESYPSDLINEMPTIGTNGVVTNKLYTRVDEFNDALTCALGYIQNSSNFLKRDNKLL